MAGLLHYNFVWTCCTFALADFLLDFNHIALAPSPLGHEFLWDTFDPGQLDHSDQDLSDLSDESLWNIDESTWTTSDEILGDIPDENLGDIAYESLLNPDILYSSCSNDGIWQSDKLRARNDRCEPSAPPLDIPMLPTLTDLENAVEEKIGPDRTVIHIFRVGYRDMRIDDPDYYCARFARETHKVPVCGSGKETDRIDPRPPYYGRIENSKPILRPYKSWTCVESEFFCCVQWLGKENTPTLGTGYDCVNLKESGWNGYDTDSLILPDDVELPYWRPWPQMPDFWIDPLFDPDDYHPDELPP